MASNEFLVASARRTEEIRTQVFAGVSGRDGSLSDALKNAYETAAAQWANNPPAPPSPHRLKILQQWATGDNPFTGYEVMVQIG